MKVTINKDVCIGCGSCAAVALKTFKMNDTGKAEVIVPVGDEPTLVKEAAEGCAVQAIKIEE